MPYGRGEPIDEVPSDQIEKKNTKTNREKMLLRKKIEDIHMAQELGIEVEDFVGWRL